MANKNSLPRRKFLQLGTRIAIGLAGLLGLGGLVRFFSHEPDPSHPTSFDLGGVSEFPIDGKMVRRDIPAVIYQTKDGFISFSLVCTHLGCTLEEDGDHFSCPCHGSQFGQDGRVLIGPATKSLTTLEIEITEESHLILSTRGGGQ
ncbi:MAG: Rieske (2Fe-2S) protein [Chloroflexi bacterium]|nr:Rieske (2Fe-2S) protein [Chloroflexota bacterium]